ncbi:MAG: ABC transporter ATP-binding protein, partial [Armatimonadota bacterium]
RWAAATCAHRVIVLDEGRILADGPTREVFGDRDVLDQAALRQPDIVRLSMELLGEVALTPDEMARRMGADRGRGRGRAQTGA